MWFACPECRDDTVFDQPPCTDGHGADCPEWFCVTCGFAVFIGDLQVGLTPVTTPARSAASSRRGARPHAA
jgi:hypothetical protein